jgi:hypothetical protein
MAPLTVNGSRTIKPARKRFTMVLIRKRVSAYWIELYGTLMAHLRRDRNDDPEFHHEMSPKAISQSQRPGLRTTRELASASVTFKLSTSDSWGNSL